MNYVPSRKSLFAPSTPPKLDYTSFEGSPDTFLPHDKPPETPSSSYTKFSPFSYPSPFSQFSMTPFGNRRISIRMMTGDVSMNKKQDMGRKSLTHVSKYNPRKMYARRVATLSKSPLIKAAEEQTPKSFKEYKYRTSKQDDGLTKDDVDSKTRILQRLSAFSAYASNIIDTRPVDLPRTRSSKRKQLHLALASSSRSASQKSFFDTVTPPYNIHTKNATIPTPTSETSDEEDILTTERMRLKKIFKRGLYASYFIGVMLSFKNKVQMFGALRPIEYLEEFEAIKPINKTNHLFPILPNSIFSHLWGIILILLLTLTAVLTPVYISFVEDNAGFFYYFNLLTDIGFGLDILFNFLTAFYDPNRELVTSFRLIALNYLRLWFWIDVAGIIPFQDVISWWLNTSPINQTHKIWRLLRIPRLYKLVKIVRLVKEGKFVSSNSSLNKLNKKLNLNTRVTKVLKIFISFAFLNHLVGCIWFYLARFQDFAPETWVRRVDLVDKDVQVQYIASLYWSFQTLTTVGYGDIAPQTSIERSVSAIWTVFGVLIYSFTVGNLSTIFLSFGVRNESLKVIVKNKLSSFEDFSRQTELPPFLCQKVKRFFEINHKENTYHWLDPNDTLKSLPVNIKTSLLLFSYYNLIKNVNVLHLNANFTAALLVHFKVLRLSRNEVIYREDDPPNEIYFISRGSVIFMNQKAQSIFSLSEGTYFGELEAIDGVSCGLRQCFCKALNTATLLVCPKEAFVKILADYPDIKTQMEKVMKSRKIKFEEKITRLQQAETSREKEKQKILLKRTEYVNKVLLKIPDSNVRFEMRRKRERSTLIKPAPSLVSLKDIPKAISLGNITNQREELSLPRKKFQKSMIDIGMNLDQNNQSNRPTGKEVNLFKSTSIKELSTGIEPPTQASSPVGKLAIRHSRQNPSLVPPLRSGEVVSIIFESGDERMESINDFNNGTLSSLLTPQTRNGKVITFKEETEEDQYELNKIMSTPKSAKKKSKGAKIQHLVTKTLLFAKETFSFKKNQNYKSKNKIAPVPIFKRNIAN